MEVNAPMADLAPWRTLGRNVVFSGGPITEIAIESVALPDGRVVDDYYTIRLPDYVLVCAQMHDGTVTLFRQYKHGPRRVCLTFPGGAIESGELPLDAARRELLEELGCAADSWTALGAFVTNGNQGCNTAHLFVASGCHDIATAHSGDLEDAEVVHVSPDTLATSEAIAGFALATHALLAALAAPALRRPPAGRMDTVV